MILCPVSKIKGDIDPIHPCESICFGEYVCRNCGGWLRKPFYHSTPPISSCVYEDCEMEIIRNIQEL